MFDFITNGKYDYLIYGAFIFCVAILIFAARRVAKINDHLKEAEHHMALVANAPNKNKARVHGRDAYACYEKAEALGSAAARTQLGHIYREGKAVDQDYEQAFNWFMKAAKGGYNEAQYYISVMYTNGEFVEKDEKKAAHWNRRAQNRRFRIGF